LENQKTGNKENKRNTRFNVHIVVFNSTLKYRETKFPEQILKETGFFPTHREKYPDQNPALSPCLGPLSCGMFAMKSSPPNKIRTITLS
jgi:hypothetical protein